MPSTHTVPESSPHARNVDDPVFGKRPKTLRDHPSAPVPWVAVRGQKSRFLWERAAQQAPALHPDALAVVMHLASKLFAGEGTVTISAEQLAALVHKSSATMATTLLHLERRGFVHRAGGGRRVPTTYRPMLPRALVEHLADHAEYEGDRPDFARLLELPAVVGMAGCAPDGSERPRQVQLTAPATVPTPVPASPVVAATVPEGAVPGYPTSLSPREVAWVRATLNRAAEMLLDDASDGAEQVEALRSHYGNLRAQERFCRRLLGLVAGPDGLTRTAALLARQRWTTAGPGALDDVIGRASASSSHKPTSPDGWPSKQAVCNEGPAPAWLAELTERLSTHPLERERLGAVA